MISYLLHYSLFNPSVNITILHKQGAITRDLLGRLQLIRTFTEVVTTGSDVMEQRVTRIREWF